MNVDNFRLLIGGEKQAGKGHKAENDDRNVIEKGARVPLKGGAEKAGAAKRGSQKRGFEKRGAETEVNGTKLPK